MEYISKCEDWVLEQYPENEENCEYKLSDYAIVNQYLGGYILFHSITWGFFFLSYDEYTNILTNKFFIDKRIVLSTNINEDEIAENVYDKRSNTLKDEYYKTLNTYVILTTNECNANCPYCYETLKIGNMSKSTAENVIKMIKEKHNDKVKITWFGGEPLKNIPIIDYITQRLREEEIEFESDIITNGLLFTSEIAEKAQNEWNLKNAQITIDGPEEQYNIIKNYDDFNGNAFQKIIENISYIRDNTEIGVNIRINVSHENIDYIEDLVTYLKENVVRGSVHFYFKLIYQIENDSDLIKKDNLLDRYFVLLEKYSNWSRHLLIKKKFLSSCMADNCSAVAILPNGTLCNCEHCSEDTYIGNVNTTGFVGKELIEEKINKMGENLDFCKKVKCRLIPVCCKYNFCNPEKRCSNIELYKIEKYKFDRKLKYTTDYYFNRLDAIKKEKGEG
jgi:sulfatase maturation enzyme AslB (radical SAM superfamily)